MKGGRFPTPSTGWHPEDIKAAIRKRGISCEELSRRLGYHTQAVGKCIRGRRWSHVEKKIAEFLGENPYRIWPDRWTKGGTPKYRAQVKRLSDPVESLS